MPKQRTAEEQREYMRDYRARQKERIAFKQGEVQAAGRIMAGPDLAALQNKIVELEAEVARLKQELAARPARPVTRVPHRTVTIDDGFGYSRPAPKPGTRKK